MDQAEDRQIGWEKEKKITEISSSITQLFIMLVVPEQNTVMNYWLLKRQKLVKIIQLAVSAMLDQTFLLE